MRRSRTFTVGLFSNFAEGEYSRRSRVGLSTSMRAFPSTITALEFAIPSDIFTGVERPSALAAAGFEDAPRCVGLPPVRARTNSPTRIASIKPAITDHLRRMAGRFGCGSGSLIRRNSNEWLPNGHEEPLNSLEFRCFRILSTG